MEENRTSNASKPFLRVIHVNENPIEAMGLLGFLAQVYDVESSTLTLRLSEIISRIQMETVDLMILDIPHALEEKAQILRLVELIREHEPVIPILMMGSDFDVHITPLAVQSGANGLFEKSCSGGELLRGIERILHGELYSTQALSEIPDGSRANAYRDHREPHFQRYLSSREFQVMNLLLAGKKLAEIGRQISLSMKTVFTYKQRLFEKLNLRNTTDLIKYAYEHELIPVGTLQDLNRRTDEKVA
jgi:two-component system invasion response regulator UvrY